MADVEDDDLEITLATPTSTAAEGPPPERLQQGQVRIRVAVDVLDTIDEHVRVDTSVEQGGVLVGHVDPESGTTVVTGSIVAVGAVSQVASLTFTHETWDHVNQVLADEHPGDQMVGWYHSHPRFGIFLSEYDQFIHQNFFAAPHHVAYVVDPVDGEHGFFGWDGGELVRVGQWETVRIEDGRRPEAGVGTPVRSEHTERTTPAGPPVVVQTAREGIHPGLVALLVLLVSGLVGAVAFALGSDDDGEAAVTEPTAAEPPVDRTPSDPATTEPPPPAPPEAAPTAAVRCLGADAAFWPLLRREPDPTVLYGTVVAPGTGGLVVRAEEEGPRGGRWVQLEGPSGIGWVPKAVLADGTATPTCTYAVRAEPSLLLRRSPGISDEPIITELPTGTTVELAGIAVRADGYTWVEVDAGGAHGYVAADFLTLRR